jgi:hypothetical protein
MIRGVTKPYMGYDKDSKIMIDSKINLDRGKWRISYKLLQLLSAFYPRLYLLESLLRERNVNLFIDHFGTKWLTDSNIIHLTELKLFNDEISLIGKRKKRSYKITESGFVNEASFGFWVELYNRNNFKFLKGIPIKIFIDLPVGMKRNNIYRILIDIKEFRNNFYHHRLNFVNNPHLFASQVNGLIQLCADLDLIINSIDPLNKKILNSQKLIYALRKTQSQISEL